MIRGRYSGLGSGMGRTGRQTAPNPNRFDTSKFENFHGRKPRGQGNWCFQIDYCDGASCKTWISTRMYTEAKAEVIRRSRLRFGMRAWQRIIVLP